MTKAAWKHAVFVHDITFPGYLKGGHSPKDIFRTLSTGLDGTPMESYAHIPKADRWALVHFIRNLSSITDDELHEMFALHKNAVRD